MNDETFQISFFIGILLNECLNSVLKLSIRQPRPALRNSYYGEFGMPSSHSQFMFFFTTYTILFLLKRFVVTFANSNISFSSLNLCYIFRLHHSRPLERIARALAIVVCVVVTLLVCYGRVYLMYHTVSQVIAGAFIGVFSGALWFLFVHVILTPFVFPRVVSWKISELLLIRDTSLIPNILFFEYTRTRQECLARSRKNMKMQ